MLALVWSFSPFFFLVVLGSLAVRARWVPADGLGALTAFVLYLAMPALLFRLGASGALHQSGLGGLLVAYGAGGAVVLGLALWWATRRHLGRLDAGLAGLVTVFPNTGFLGLPLLTGLLGPKAAGPLVATLLVDVVLFSSFCLAWAHSAGQAGDAGPLRAAMASLRGALRNPLLWGMGLGMAWGQTGLAVATPVDETLRLLGLAATPAALFTLGGILVRPVKPDAEAAAHRPLNLPALMVPATLKLLLHPALVWACAWQLGLPAQGLGAATLIMAAALPSASNVSMLAEREGARTPAVPRIILLSTALAVISLACWAQALGLTPTSPP
jgi:malonate transporter